MATTERNGDGSEIRSGGVYRHPDTGEELVTQATAKFGNPQADAVVRAGFVYVGPAKFEERDQNEPGGPLVAALDPGAGPIANTSPSQKSVSELETDLTTAKEREKLVQRAQNGKSGLVDAEAVKAAEPTPAPEEKGAK